MSKKKLDQALQDAVTSGLLVEIDYDTKNPQFQEINAFLENKFGVMARYTERCVACGEPIDREQEEYTRCVVNNDFQYLHGTCQKNNGLKWTVKEIEYVLKQQKQERNHND